MILFEQWSGHRLLCEKVTRHHVRANRPILIPSVPVSEGIEFRHGCQFLSGSVRALAKLPGGGLYLAIMVLTCLGGFSWPLLQAIGILNALKLFVGFWGTLQGQLQSFWMGLLSSVTVPLFFLTFSLLVFPQGW